MEVSPSSGGSVPGSPQGYAPDEAASLQLILSMGRAFKFVDDYVRPRMQKHGLTMTEFSVLMVLWHGGPTPLGELSQRILLTGASTTYTVTKMEKRGLIARESRSEDKRVVMGVITEKVERWRRRLHHCMRPSSQKQCVVFPPKKRRLRPACCASCVALDLTSAR